MITTTHNATGEITGVQIDSTVYSEAALLTLLSRLQRAEGDRERLRAENERLQRKIDYLDGPRIPRLEPDDYAAIARLSDPT
jgi:hypothetical protein